MDYSKDINYYVEKVDGALSVCMRDLFINYSKISSENVHQDLYAVVSCLADIETDCKLVLTDFDVPLFVEEIVNRTFGGSASLPHIAKKESLSTSELTPPSEADFKALLAEFMSGEAGTEYDWST